MSLEPPSRLPHAFLARLEQILEPSQLERWRAVQAAPQATVFRVNTLRAEPDAVLSELRSAGLEPEPLAELPLAYRLPESQRRALTESAAFGEGRVYVQNPASMLPPLVLDPRPGQEVLDLCAAPGSKTTQLAALMAGEGRVAAVERSRSRFFKLQAVCRQLGAERVQTYLMDGRAVARKTPERFDRVLVDAPCSSEARFRDAEPETYAYWSEKKVRDMARLQKRLLWAGFQALKPGGVLVYSTCTYAPEENEAVVQDLLRRAGETARLEAPQLPVEDWAAGLPQWRGKPFDPVLAETRRILPTPVMEGFFLARIRKGH